MDGILRTLEGVGILMGRQTDELNVIVTTNAKAIVAATNGNNENHGYNGNVRNLDQGQVNAVKQMR